MHRKIFLLIFIGSLLRLQASAQIDTLLQQKSIVYKKVNPYVTYPIIIGGFITNYIGIRILKNKPGIDQQTASMLTPADVNAFDRGATHQNTFYNQAKQDMKISDIGLTSSSFLPLLLLANTSTRKDFLQISLIYLETMSIISNMYSWGVGHINRKRPYVFNPEEDITRRTRRGSFNSFYCGHCAATATASFFVAKVLNDYYVGNRGVKLFYVAALVPPAAVGYFRYKSGMHFPSDILAGTVVGTGVGLLVPELHRYKIRRLSVTPFGNSIFVTYKL